MENNTMIRVSLILSTALAAALVAPGAFAQDAAAARQAQPMNAQDAAQAKPQADANAQKPKTWEDLDTDSNGSLSMGEASAEASVAQIFPKADADGNGELTGEEYKAWLASSGSSTPDQKP